MKSSFSTVAGVIVVSAALPLAVVAEESGWKMPNLNPFSSSGQKSGSGQPPTSGWKMPNLLPPTATTAKARPKRKSNQPTTWNKMTTGTQQFFSKTADAINPWDDKKPAAPPKNLTGSNTAFTHNNAAKKTASGSSSVAPASWFGSDKGDPSKTVNGFLSQPRPQ